MTGRSSYISLSREEQAYVVNKSMVDEEGGGGEKKKKQLSSSYLRNFSGNVIRRARDKRKLRKNSNNSVLPTPISTLNIDRHKDICVHTCDRGHFLDQLIVNDANICRRSKFFFVRR